MKTINTTVLRTMCEIHYSFNEFINALKKLEIEDVKSTSNKIENLVNGKSLLGNKELKLFVKKYDMELEEINKKMSVKEFIEYAITHYDELLYFHEYLEENEIYMYKIREVLDKILSSIPYLNELTLNTSLTKEEGSISTTLNYNQNFKYFDNMKYIPAYEGDRVSYVSFDPNYEMNIKVNNTNPLESELICDSITVKSLTFDPSSIPSEVSVSETFKKIINLLRDRKESKSLRNIINNQISIIDLEFAYDEIEEFVGKLDNLEDKKDLLLSLRYLKASINKYKEASSDFVEKEIASSEVIDEKLIRKEKMLYIKRRTWSAYNQD